MVSTRPSRRPFWRPSAWPFALSFPNQFFGIGRHRITSRARRRLAQLVTEPARRVAGLRRQQVPHQRPHRFATTARQHLRQQARRVLQGLPPMPVPSHHHELCDTALQPAAHRLTTTSTT